MYLSAYPTTSSVEEAAAVGPVGSGVQKALDWIHAHVEQVYRAGGRILAVLASAEDLAIDARGAGDLETAVRAERLARDADDLYPAWERARAMVQWVTDRVPGLGLGAWVVPVLVATAALGAAAYAATVLARLELQERALEALEKGTLTPAEARELGLDLGGAAFPGLSVGFGVGTLVAVGAGAWLWSRSRA